MLSALMLTTIALAGAAEQNAWEAWTRPLPTVDENALWPVEALAPDRLVDARELHKLELDGIALESALLQARDGLDRRRCHAEGHAQVLRPMKLGRRVTAVAVLRSSRGGDAAEAAETVLDLGRAVARCEGSLLTFEIGRSIEAQGRALAIWLAATPGADEQVVARLRRRLRKRRLKRGDLALAIEREGRFSVTMLPDDVAGTSYSRTRTRTLLLEHTRSVARAVRKGERDLALLRTRVDGLLRDEEQKLLAGVGDSTPHVELPARVAKLADGLAVPDNLAGRMIVHRLGASLVDVTQRAIAELDEAQGALRAFDAAHAAPRPPPKKRPAVALDDDAVPHAASAGRCKRVSEGLYVLDDIATRELREAWGPMLAKEARLVPHFVDGEAIGMQLHGFAPDSLAGSCGLEAGDILLTVNGVDLDTPATALLAPTRVAEEGEARFTVQRGAVRIQLIVRPGK
jgi:hypothetical protein